LLSPYAGRSYFDMLAPHEHRVYEPIQIGVPIILR